MTLVVAITLSKLNFKMISIISAVLLSQFFPSLILLSAKRGICVVLVVKFSSTPNSNLNGETHRFLDNQITPLMLIMLNKKSLFHRCCFLRICLFYGLSFH